MARGFDADRSMIRNGARSSVSPPARVTSAVATSRAMASEFSATNTGGANETSTASANSFSFDPNYRFTTMAVTPASPAISRTPTPSYPARAKCLTAEFRMASRVAAAFRDREGPAGMSFTGGNTPR
jgi:hypothetical protein